jgi:hypothetical protein
MSWLWATATKDCSESVVLHAPVVEGCIAFVNGGTEAELWGRDYPADPGADRLAAAEFVATARAAVAAAGTVGGRTIVVLGYGLMAELLRNLLPESTPAIPEIMIDTTGLPEHISEATATLPRLGHLILTAPPRTSDVELATYRDLHVRALTVTGVPWMSMPPDGGSSDTAIGAALKRLVHTAPGHSARRDAWYAIHDGRPG